jgi:hypothetical protein
MVVTDLELLSACSGGHCAGSSNVNVHRLAHAFALHLQCVLLFVAGEKLHDCAFIALAAPALYGSQI